MEDAPVRCWKILVVSIVLFGCGAQERPALFAEPSSGEILSSFGRPGHEVGNFTHGHTIALDSAGNIYVAETNYGRRLQRFKPVETR